MLLILIVICSIVIGIALISILLAWFVRKAMKNNNDILALWLVGLLVIQFILGMLSNLFVTIPKVAPYDVWHHAGPIEFHSINALILIILSVIFLIQAFKTKHSRTLGIVALFSIFIATYYGIMFILFRQNDTYSFIMSLGFTIAFLLFTYRGFSVLKHS